MVITQSVSSFRLRCGQEHEIGEPPFNLNTLTKLAVMAQLTCDTSSKPHDRCFSNSYCCLFVSCKQATYICDHHNRFHNSYIEQPWIAAASSPARMDTGAHLGFYNG